MSDPFENPYGPDPIELTPQAQAFYDRHLKADTPKGRVIGISTPAEPESLWIKQAFLEATASPDPDIRHGEYGYLGFDGNYSFSYKAVGDQTTEGEECIKVYERYAARHMGKRRSFLARLADSVRGQK